MLEDSTAPTGRILARVFCGLKDPADVSRGAEGAGCERGSVDTTVARTCGWRNTQRPLVTARSVLSRFACSHLRVRRNALMAFSGILHCQKKSISLQTPMFVAQLCEILSTVKSA